MCGTCCRLSGGGRDEETNMFFCIIESARRAALASRREEKEAEGASTRKRNSTVATSKGKMAHFHLVATLAGVLSVDGARQAGVTDLSHRARRGCSRKFPSAE